MLMKDKEHRKDPPTSPSIYIRHNSVAMKEGDRKPGCLFTNWPLKKEPATIPPPQNGRRLFS